MPEHDIPPAPDRTTVVVAHADVGRRAALAGVLGQSDDIDLVGDCGSLAEAADLATTLVPDVLLIDRRLPDGRPESSAVDAFGLSASIAATLPAIHIVIVTDAGADDDGPRFVASGAIGLVLDQALDERATEVVRRAARGEALVTPTWAATLAQVIDGSSDPIPESLASFSDDEMAVVRALGEGVDAAEIATRLNVPERAVNLLAASALAKARRARADQALLEP